MIIIMNVYTPSSQSKIRVFSDPTLGPYLSAAVKLPIRKGFWATQPLKQILVAEFLLCELGVSIKGSSASPPDH